MNITLYYVPGINETDTPVFDSLANQALFFSEQERYVISSGFYPPYLRNTITLDVSSYSLTSVYNYLSLEYNSKVYYYFIRRKEYVNEDVIRLYVEMDTIQTYMFNVNFIYSHVNRETIERWGNLFVINRDYLRENVSAGIISKLDDIEYYNIDKSQWVFLSRATSIPIEGYTGQTIDHPASNYSTINIDPKYSYSTFRYTFYGYIVGTTFYNGDMKFSSSATYNNILNDQNFFYTKLSNTEALDAYVIPFNPFADVTITYDGTSTLMTVPDIPNGDVLDATDTCILIGKARRQGMSDDALGFAVSKKALYNILLETINLPFIPNIQLNIPFEYKYVPCLFDENYVLVDFGNASSRTSYPLFTINNTYDLDLAYWADISTGNLYFNIVPSNIINKTNNDYFTIVSTKSPLSLELRNDAWKEYLARNRNSIMTTLLSTATDVVKANEHDIFNGTGMKQILNFNIGNAVANSVIGATKNLIKISDIANAPDTVKSKGVYSSDLLLGDAYIFSRVAYVNDITECARYFETYGNHVSKEYTTSLFAINNRYYYDYVQTESLNILIGDRETEENFINRFNKGLRLWHTTNGVLHAVDSGLEMGQVCIYDNVESKYIN